MRDEARRMLTAYERIAHRGPAKERNQAIEVLATLPLHSPEVKGARDACVSAHRALLAAEGAHEKAAASLDQVLAVQTAGEPLALADTTRIQTEIAAAERALEAARERFTPCENQVQSLSLRYAKRGG